MSAVSPDPRPRRGVRRGLLAALGALLLVVVLAGAWAAWTAWHVRADLAAASDSAHRLRTALTRRRPGRRRGGARRRSRSRPPRPPTAPPARSGRWPSTSPSSGTTPGRWPSSAARWPTSRRGPAPHRGLGRATSRRQLHARANGRLPVDDIEELQEPRRAGQRGVRGRGRQPRRTWTTAAWSTPYAGRCRTCATRSPTADDTLAAASRAVQPAARGCSAPTGERRFLAGLPEQRRGPVDRRHAGGDVPGRDPRGSGRR